MAKISRRKKPTGRIYHGNHPPLDKGQLLAMAPHFWALYLISRADGWYNLKLVATVRQPATANFWIAFNVTDGRWALTRDCQRLQNDAPAVAQWVEKVVGMVDANPEDWRVRAVAAWERGSLDYPAWGREAAPLGAWRPSEAVSEARKIGRVAAERVGVAEGFFIVHDERADLDFMGDVKRAEIEALGVE